MNLMAMHPQTVIQVWCSCGMDQCMCTVAATRLCVCKHSRTPHSSCATGLCTRDYRVTATTLQLCTGAPAVTLFVHVIHMQFTLRSSWCWPSTDLRAAHAHDMYYQPTFAPSSLSRA